jgi:hypothetical protein
MNDENSPQRKVSSPREKEADSRSKGNMKRLRTHTYTRRKVNLVERNVNVENTVLMRIISESVILAREDGAAEQD